MAKKHEQLLAKYQGNAWPAMLDTLAEQLGVTADSLARLELGWAPVVEFKKGKNSQGWWVIPERDERGEPVGLSLRNMGGFKCMYPGSNHGLVYEPNPEHERGCMAYKHGAHNWMRLYDAGVDCPVCGKPDGCLVSSDDPDDPKAAVCIRTKEGAEKPMKFGYLHILKDEGRVASAPILPKSDYPVVVVEGMTDTAAAMDLGFVAVGRPSNKAGLGLLKELVRNREVIVVGENDEAGVEGMVAAFQIVKETAKDIKQVLPPEHIKDLRQWKQTGDLTRDGLIQYAEEHGHEPHEEKVLANDKSLTLARAFLDARYRLNGRYLLRYDKGVWYKWNGVKYEEADEKVHIHGPIHNWAYDKSVIHTTPKGEETVKPLHCNMSTVNNIIDAMYDPCPLPEGVRSPCWMNGAEGPPPEELLVFSNGILWTHGWLWSGKNTPMEDYFFPHTPDLFSTFALPYPFDPTARCRHYKFKVKEMLARDYDRINMYQEWGGYLLTPLTKFQKMLMMRGPKGAGKTVLLNMLGHMVGGQAAAPNFHTLTTEFGLHELFEQQVALMDEAKMTKGTDTMQALENLLKITGEASFNIPRKFKEALKGYTFPTRFTLTCNEIPNLPDPNGAMQRRLMILDFPHEFTTRPDPDLENKLCKELPGIVLWHLQGYKRLVEQGRFTEPAGMVESLKEFATTTNPLAAFIEECCEEDEEYSVAKEEIFDAWHAWANEHGFRPISKSRMYERIKSAAQYAKSETYEKGGHKYSVFRGIKLKPWAERRLLGKPD